MNAPAAAAFGWPAIVRLGLVQAAIGAIVVLTTSTLNRVMVVELGLPALLPGLLLALHHAVQLVRPRVGHGADGGRRRTPWIVGGMAVLATGGLLAALATVLLGSDRESDRYSGLVLAVAAFVLIGLGVAAAGTSLLALLAQRVAPGRRAAAATTVWMLMIAGFVVTAGVAGQLLDPYSPTRLLAVAAGVCAAAFGLSVAALFGLEGRASPTGDGPVGVAPGGTPAAAAAPGTADASGTAGASRAPHAPLDVQGARRRFGPALRALWREREARGFTVFVFVSMLAFSAQDLILEPFAGAVFGLTPGGSTRLSGVQHAGALLGMLLAAGAGRRIGGVAWGGLRAWTVGGCLASALALGGLALAGAVGPGWPLRANVFALGLATGAFSIAAIGSMMRLAAAGGPGREGLRMGLWGAAQAIAFALGGVLGTGASDLARWLLGSPGAAYAAVFALEAALFVAAARLAARIEPAPRASTPLVTPSVTPLATPPATGARHEAAGLL